LLLVIWNSALPLLGGGRSCIAFAIRRQVQEFVVRNLKAGAVFPAGLRWKPFDIEPFKAKFLTFLN